MKNKNTIIYYIFALLISLNINLYSQDKSSKTKSSINGKITGKVIESESGKGLAYTNIYVKSPKDDAVLTGAISDQKGNFSVKNLPNGEYYVDVKFIGYKKLRIDDIKITNKQKHKKLGTITLQLSAAVADEVVVVGDKMDVEYLLDKKVVNVSKNINSAGGSAVDALENVPSVDVDIEGSVSLRGSSNFTVFVNGKPSILSGTDALEIIPAETIDKIEIITNPSAKYDPEGMAGIMNVILKKEIQSGFNGIINAGIGSNNKYNGDFLVNYFNDKINFFIGGNYRDNNYNGYSLSEQETYTDTNTFMIRERDRVRQRENHSGRFGIGYQFSEKTSAALEGNAGLYESKRMNFSNISYWEGYDGLLLGDTVFNYNEEVSNRSHQYIGINTNLSHKFNDLGHKLDANFNYSINNSDEPSAQSEYDTDATYSIKDLAPSKKIRTSEKSDDEYQWRLNVDYTNPISDVTSFEAGYQARFANSTEAYDYEDFDYENSQWLHIDSLSNVMDFSRMIHSSYVTFASALGDDNKFSYLLGLRGEYTKRETGLKSDYSFVIDRFDFFPTVHTAYSINKKNQVSASYSRRIDRPRGWFLEPYTSYIDEYTRRVGNPELEPEYSNSYEVNYQYAFAKSSFVSVEAFHKHNNNLISRFREYDAETNLTYHYFKNIDDDYSTGIELMLNWKPINWFAINVSGNYYNYRIQSNTDGQVIDQNDNTFSGKSNVTFNILEDTRLQVSANYRGASVTAQGRSEDSWRMNLALRQEFLKRSLSVVFSVRDVFGTGNREYTSYGINSMSHDYMERESPQFRLNLSYRINNYKDNSKYKEYSGEGEED